MKSSAQTKVQNFAKDKISMVQDKVQDIKGDVKDFTKDQITGAKEKIGNFINKKKIREKEEAEIKTLRNNLNVVEKMEGNRFKVTVEQKYRRPGDVSFAESNAIQNAKILILNKMGGERYQFERAVKHLEKYVENNDGTYSYFLIVSFEVE